MAKTIFITGGARSGKSRMAELTTLEFGAPLCYIATAQPLDGEMNERIRRHQLRRGEAWRTVEEPIRLSEALAHCEGNCQAILVDCITLWLTNLLFLYEDQGEKTEELVMQEVEELATTLERMQTPVILVTNEVGLGIVPENRLARQFRDIAGQANQILAEVSDQAWFVASGIPMRLK